MTGRFRRRRCLGGIVEHARSSPASSNAAGTRATRRRKPGRWRIPTACSAFPTSTSMRTLLRGTSLPERWVYASVRATLGRPRERPQARADSVNEECAGGVAGERPCRALRRGDVFVRHRMMKPVRDYLTTARLASPGRRDVRRTARTTSSAARRVGMTPVLRSARSHRQALCRLSGSHHRAR